MRTFPHLSARNWSHWPTRFTTGCIVASKSRVAATLTAAPARQALLAQAATSQHNLLCRLLRLANPLTVTNLIDGFGTFHVSTADRDNVFHHGRSQKTHNVRPSGSHTGCGVRLETQDFHEGSTEWRTPFLRCFPSKETLLCPG